MGGVEEAISIYDSYYNSLKNPKATLSFEKFH